MDIISRATTKTTQEIILEESSRDYREGNTLGKVGNNLLVSIEEGSKLSDPTSVVMQSQTDTTTTMFYKENKPYTINQGTIPKGRFIAKPAVAPYSCRQIVIDDPDKDCKNDPEMMTEYIQDIFEYLKTMEDKYPIRKGFLDGHEITPRMRGILIDWLIEMHLKFKMPIETLHLCVNLVDRYIQDNENLTRDIYQLVGTTALLIASKYENTCSPRLFDYKFICGHIYSRKKILKMERDILDKLDFGLGRPSSIHFLKRYGQIAKVCSIHHNLGKYMLELALMKYDMNHVKPSLQAAAACCLSMGILNDIGDLSKLWTPTLIHYTGYIYAEFEDVVVRLAKLLTKSESLRFHTIRRKYAGLDCDKISSNPLLLGSLVRKLAGMTTNQ